MSNSSSNRSPYRIHCSSIFNRSPYRIQCNSSSNTGLPIGYSVIVALTGLPIGYSVIVALTDLSFTGVKNASSQKYRPSLSTRKTGLEWKKHIEWRFVSSETMVLFTELD